MQPIDSVLLVVPQRRIERAERDWCEAFEIPRRARPVTPASLAGDGHSVIGRECIQCAGLPTIEPIDADLFLPRVAIAQKLIKFIEQAGIEDRDLAVLAPHVTLPALQQSCDVRAGKGFTACGREMIGKLEPLLA